MDFGGESELNDLTKKFKDSIELANINTSEPKQRKFTPFRTKYESSSNIDKIHTVEQELSKLKELQSQVLTMQGTLEETIEKEVKKTKEKEIKEIRNRYKTKIREIEANYRKKEEEIKTEYEEKLNRIIEKIKEKARETITRKVAEEIEKAKKSADKKILEVKLRDKTIIDKLSQMYIDLKEKYKKDVQKTN